MYIGEAEEAVERAEVDRGRGIRGLTTQQLLHLRVVKQLRERREHAHDLRTTAARWCGAGGQIKLSIPFLRYSSARRPVCPIDRNKESNNHKSYHASLQFIFIQLFNPEMIYTSLQLLKKIATT
jgi:hypothetical protein